MERNQTNPILGFLVAIVALSSCGYSRVDPSMLDGRHAFIASCYPVGMLKVDGIEPFYGYGMFVTPGPHTVTLSRGITPVTKCTRNCEQTHSVEAKEGRVYVFYEERQSRETANIVLNDHHLIPKGEATYLGIYNKVCKEWGDRERVY